MELRRIAGLCDDIKTCPAIYTKGGGVVVVQGAKVDAETRGLMNIPGHEDAVELTADLIVDAYRQLETEGLV